MSSGTTNGGPPVLQPAPEPDAAAGQDFVTLEDFAEAIDLLLFVENPDAREHALAKAFLDVAEVDASILLPVAVRFRTNAAAHLDRKLERMFRERMPMRTEEQAAAALFELARSVKGAATGLRWAAQRLRSKGDVHGANQTMQAAVLLEGEAAAYLG